MNKPASSLPRLELTHAFRASLQIIGVNPYVTVPDGILQAIFQAADKAAGPIPICGTLNGLAYTQTLVRFAGEWRLYVNTKMLKNSPQRIGEMVDITVAYDPRDRALPLHPDLAAALEDDATARAVFEGLSPSRQLEINRYICNLKSADKVTENVARAIAFLHGQGRFVGRDRP